MVKYNDTSGTGKNTISHHTRLNNGRKCYLELKRHFKIESFEETKSSEANAILQSSHYGGNRKFALDHYYNLVVISVVQLEEAGSVYTLT